MAASKRSRLRLHSLPLVLLAVAVTVTSLVTVASIQDGGGFQALTRPALSPASTDKATAGVPTDSLEVVRLDLPGDSSALDGVTDLGDAAVLQQTVTQAFRDKAQ